MRLGRWVVGLGALLMAALALYVLTGDVMTSEVPADSAGTEDWQARPDRAPVKPSAPAASIPASEMPATRAPALDEIDEDSRKAMRELLKEAEDEDRW